MDEQRANPYRALTLAGAMSAGRAVRAALRPGWLPARIVARVGAAWPGSLVALLGLLALGYKPTFTAWHAGVPWVLPIYQDVLLGAGDLCLIPLALIGGLAWIRAGRPPLGTGLRVIALAGGVLVACLLASAAVAQAPALSLACAVQVTVGGLALLAVASQPPLGRWMLLGGAVLALVQLPIIALQLATQSTFPMGRLFDGYPEEIKAAMSGAAVVIGPGGTRWQRAVGTFPHPNILGGFAACAVILALPWLRRRDWVGRMAMVVWAAAWVELILSFSRSALLAALLGVGLWLLGQAWVWPTRRSLLWLAGPPAAALVAGGFLLGATFWQRLAPSRSILREPALTERQVIADVALTLIRAQPLRGVGAGNFTLAELRPPFNAISVEPVHTIPLLIAAEAGLPAAIAWLVLLLGAPLAAWRQGTWGARCTCLALPLALLTLALLDHYCWTYPPGRALFWLSLGVWVARFNVPGFWFRGCVLPTLNAER